MLPEKRKNLIITIVSIVLLFILILGLFKISSYIKSKNQEIIKDNNNYPNKYIYFGITYDSEDTLYKFYGINTNYEEEYLNLGTFYNVKDAIFLNKRLIIYSDSVNEIRYDSKTNEYYFYEIDSYYNRNMDVNLTNDYVIYNDNNVLGYYSYGNKREKETIISNAGIVYGNIFVSNNRVYYTLLDGIYEYNLETKEKNTLVHNINEVPLNVIKANSSFIYYKSLDIDLVLKIQNKTIIELVKDTNMDNIKYIDYYINGLLYIKSIDNNNYIKKYSLMNEKEEDFELNINNNQVKKSYQITDDLYYMIFYNENKETYNLVDIKNKKIINLEHDYLYLIGGSNEN